MKNFISRSILVVLTMFSFSTVTKAVELDEATLTIPLNNSKTITFTPEQAKRGKRLFLSTCSVCHTGVLQKQIQMLV